MNEELALKEIYRLLNELEGSDIMTEETLRNIESQVETLIQFGDFEDTNVETSSVLQENLSDNTGILLQFKREPGTRNGSGNNYKFTRIYPNRQIDCDPGVTVSNLQNML